MMDLPPGVLREDYVLHRTSFLLVVICSDYAQLDERFWHSEIWQPVYQWGISCFSDLGDSYPRLGWVNFRLFLLQDLWMKGKWR